MSALGSSTNISLVKRALHFAPKSELIVQRDAHDVGVAALPVKADQAHKADVQAKFSDTISWHRGDKR